MRSARPIFWLIHREHKIRRHTEKREDGFPCHTPALFLSHHIHKHGNICPGSTHTQGQLLSRTECVRAHKGRSDNKSTWAREREEGSFYLSARGVTSVEAVCYFYCLIIMAPRKLNKAAHSSGQKTTARGDFCVQPEQRIVRSLSVDMEVKKSERMRNNGHAGE